MRYGPVDVANDSGNGLDAELKELEDRSIVRLRLTSLAEDLDKRYVVNDEVRTWYDFHIVVVRSNVSLRLISLLLAPMSARYISCKIPCKLHMVYMAMAYRTKTSTDAPSGICISFSKRGTYAL